MGNVCCKQGFEVPSWHELIILYTTLYWLRPVRHHPRNRRLRARDTDGIPLNGFLRSPSRRHHFRRLGHLHRKTVVAPGGHQTNTGEGGCILGGNGCKGYRLLLGNSVALLDVADVARWTQRSWVQYRRQGIHWSVLVGLMETMGMTPICCFL